MSNQSQDNCKAHLVYQKENKGKLYLGGEEAAKDINFLQQNQIKSVLTLTSNHEDTDENVNYDSHHQINHKVVRIIDCPSYDIRTNFDECLAFLEHNINNNNTLVHCTLGVSRSPTIVIAYLMKYQQLRFSEAFNKIKQNRNVINPNGGFIFRLGQYEKQLQSKN